MRHLNSVVIICCRNTYSVSWHLRNFRLRKDGEFDKYLSRQFLEQFGAVASKNGAKINWRHVALLAKGQVTKIIVEDMWLLRMNNCRRHVFTMHRTLLCINRSLINVIGVGTFTHIHSYSSKSPWQTRVQSSLSNFSIPFLYFISLGLVFHCTHIPALLFLIILQYNCVIYFIYFTWALYFALISTPTLPWELTWKSRFYSLNWDQEARFRRLCLFPQQKS